MTDNLHLLQVANGLRPLAVRNYAESRGWKQVVEPKGRLWVLNHSQYKLRQLQIPIDSEFEGSDQAMLDVALRLADIEEREVTSVLADLLHADSDTLRFRMATWKTQSGDISLSEDINLREGARRLLLAAASSVLNPVRHHPRLSRSPAEQLVRSCLSGQTELGSYVMKVMCPLNAVDNDTIFTGSNLSSELSDPFVRRTTRLLMQATSGLAKSIEDGDVDSFLESDALKPMLSWNLCDALLRMKPEHEGALELGVSWASRPDLTPPAEVPVKVSFKTDYFPEIERAAQRLRPLTPENKSVLLIGTVESLNGSVGEDEKRAGEVTLVVFVEDEVVRAKAVLDSKNYAFADIAHMQGNAYVKIEGMLRRTGRTARIENVTRLELL